ncbi:hypothetical protein CC1G_00320 [Coprinopsis cinerea okayama7|uniref:Uncharacterized protein n=1 Tax=Coprinopsis cinerea (strain Okayama-7 / 130 / ATCC MYA-4618 / FGSC 9003) TaxID=240176 RepID=A8NXJ2_COPC7|nr:hypothetical protein CC1G_00320 [Coprinopsis cinerea okayama7\|eukprot:XP_001837184.2 hypothetical protein CC1G_00320 [Coprinopsis cinerea okayama7\
MPLFQENRWRSAIVATVAVGLGHFVTKMLVSPGSSQLLQSFVAVIAIGALVFLIIMHHRQEGQILTQPQEEAALIGGLALLWIVIVVGWRALSGGGDESGIGYSRGGAMSRGYSGFKDDPGYYYDVVEEYIW